MPSIINKANNLTRGSGARIQVCLTFVRDAKNGVRVYNDPFGCEVAKMRKILQRYGPILMKTIHGKRWCDLSSASLANTWIDANTSWWEPTPCHQYRD